MRLAAAPTRLLGRAGAWWIERRRRRHGAAAAPLPADALEALAPFFPAETLGAARLAIVPRIHPPAVLSLARRLGLGATHFDRVLGITFADTIVIASRVSGPALLSTLFHELVHVEQVRQLGLRRFIERYVREWIEEGDYDAIRLERDAYGLQRRFEDAPEEPFDVAAEVARRLAGA
jgi:hypothetical protein